jgi:precorrin-2 dehydrogenase/sirohydrochlorin ferrochelatase
MAKLFPVLIDIEGKKCVVFGGGSVAERKVKTLLDYGAKITLISPEITEKLKQFILEGKIEYFQREYKKGDTKDAFLVVPATSDSNINEKIAKEAKFLVNLVEKKKINKLKAIIYTVPAIVEKGDLTIAISTEFPALSKLLKEEIEKFYGKDFALYLKYLNKLRREIQKKIPDDKERQKIFKKIASKKTVSILRQNGFKKAKKEIEKIINEV